jgi:asparagine synthase (glutamine-hydrolysing)
MNPGIAGVYEPGGGETRTTLAALRGAFAPWEQTAVVSANGLAAGRAPDEPVRDGRVICLLAGRIHNLSDVAREVGCAADAGAESVLGRAYAERGDEMLHLLRGSFAVLVWDRVAERGLVAQDQVTNRTVYYTTLGSRLFFASDIAPLLRLLPRRPAPDPVGIVRWLGNSSPPEPLTLYEGVLKVGFGRMLRLERDGWTLATYWRPRYRSPQRRPREEIVAELWTNLVDAVATRIPSDERTGLVMSGGIDSSAVAAAVSATARGAVRGYSAVFPDDPEFDESRRIALLSSALELPSVQFEPRPGGSYALSLEYLNRWDVPLLGAGYVLERPLLDRAVADGVTGVLDGQGGDELFGFAPYLVGDRLRAGRVVSSVRLARAFPNLGQRAPWRHTLHLWRRFGWQAAMPDALHRRARRLRGRMPRYLNPESARLFVETDTRWQWRRHTEGPLWWAWKASILTREREEIGLPEYVRHRAALAGLDARLPLMDIRLVEASLEIPPDYEFDQRFDRPLIRAAMKGVVPDEIRLSPLKSNLAPYYHRGIVEVDLPWIRRLLLAPDAEVYRYVDRAFVERLLERPPKVGDPSWIYWLSPIWAVVTTETWLRRQADPSHTERLLAEDLPRPAADVVSAPS